MRIDIDFLEYKKKQLEGLIASLRYTDDYGDGVSTAVYKGQIALINEIIEYLESD